MADLVTRILANDTQFNDAIARSKKEINLFETAAKGFGSGIIQGAAAAAIALGAGAGAVELFDKAVNSSQATGDAWNRTIEAGKSVVDEFFYSIVSGDFSNFAGGLDLIISQAKAATDAIDQLGNTVMSYTYFTSKYDAEIAKYRQKALDVTLDMGERQEALKLWKEVLDKKQEAGRTQAVDSQDALYKKIAKGTQLKDTDFDIKDIEEIYALDIAVPEFREKDKAKLAEEYEKYSKEVMRLQSIANPKIAATSNEFTTGTETIDGKSDKAIQAKKEIELLTQKHKKAILYNQLLEKYKDEDLQETMKLARMSNDVNRVNYQDLQTYDRASKRVMNEAKKDNKDLANSSKVASKEALQGSLDWYSAEIKSLQQQLSNSTDVNVSGKLQQQINQLNDEKINLQFVIDSMAFKQLHGELETKFKENPISLTKGLETDLSTLEIAPFEPIKNDTVANVDNTTQAVYALGNAMSSLNSITSEGAGGWLQYAASVANSVAMAIPQIMLLTAAKRQEANANAASATTGAASSVASIPFVGPLMAVAAVASVLAALVNIPKFATGGIVPGGSFIGDKVPVLANSGEMILNNKQQSNLFSMLDKGSSNNAVVSFSESRVRGSDIYLSLSNYMKKTGKKL